MKSICVVVAVLGAIAAFVRDQPESGTGNRAALEWVARLARPEGGFAPDLAPGSVASLRSTVQAVRALKYFGGQVPDKEKVISYYVTFWDEQRGGFAPRRGGSADAATTAMALMGISDLGGAERNRERIQRGLRFLVEHSQDFEEIRIGAAAFESLRKPCPVAAKWQERVLARAGADGVYGSGGNRARETGSSVVTLLRLGAPVPNKQRVIATLLQGQRKDGGWGKADEASDLETCYRVMRACFMLRVAPDTNALRRFVATCREADGAYAIQPGQKGSVQATYYAGIIQHWLDELK